MHSYPSLIFGVPCPAFNALLSLFCSRCYWARAFPLLQTPTHVEREPKLASVDLPRYMGRWYIVANIPYFVEDNFVGSYAQWKLRDDGKIDDSYYAHKGSFDAPLKHYQFTDSIVPGTNNAEWSVRIFWPIYASQQTVYVDADYQYTILGYPGKSYLFSRVRRYQRCEISRTAGPPGRDGLRHLAVRRVPQTPEQIGRPGFPRR